MPGLTLCDEVFRSWLSALEARHLSELRPSELTRALRALSSIYVERRGRLETRGTLDSAGKRAAFALFYAPLHFLLVRAIVRGIGAASPPPRAIVDLGCGSGVAGAVWSLEADRHPKVLGIDTHPWAVAEATWTYKALGIRGRARRSDLVAAARVEPTTAVVAAFAVNELAAADRAAVLEALLRSAERGARGLVVEPIARSAATWWPEWSRPVLAARGRSDEWRVWAQSRYVRQLTKDQQTAIEREWLR